MRLPLRSAVIDKSVMKTTFFCHFLAYLPMTSLSQRRALPADG